MKISVSLKVKLNNEEKNKEIDYYGSGSSVERKPNHFLYLITLIR